MNVYISLELLRIKIKMEQKQTQFSKTELSNICRKLKIWVSESRCHEDHIELYIQKDPKKPNLGSLSDSEKKVLIDIKDIDADAIKKKLIKFNNDCDTEFQKIINGYLLHVFPMFNSELYQKLKEIYRRIKDDGIIPLPSCIRDDDLERGVSFFWSNLVSVQFDINGNSIYVVSTEEDEPEENDDADEAYVFGDHIDFDFNEIDLLIDYLRDCFIHGKTLHSKEYYLKKKLNV